MNYFKITHTYTHKEKLPYINKACKQLKLKKRSHRQFQNMHK